MTGRTRFRSHRRWTRALGVAALVGSALAPRLHAQPPPPPDTVVVRAGDGRVIVRWPAVAGADGYRVERSDAGGPFTAIGFAARPRYAVDLGVTNGVEARYRVVSVRTGGISGTPSDTVAAHPRVLTDDDFLELVARTAFDFFWEEAHPTTGLIPDRITPVTGARSSSSIAAVGFALTAYGVAAERGWITRAQAAERTRRTLDALWNAPQGTATSGTSGHRGFFYHFLDLATATRAGTNELSTIDTALLLGGVRYARAFFDGDSADEARIRTVADALTDRVDWAWAAPRSPLVSLGWTPESGFLPYDWVGYNEAMLVYLLGLGSTTHPLPDGAWARWASTYRWESYYSAQPYVPFGPLFGHQYSHVWVDFRGRRDAFMRAKGSDYFENSRRATLAQRAYTNATRRFAGYDADGWGITASDDPEGYSARGALPAENDDGTLAPTGPGGSYPFAPTESAAALRAFYDRYPALWGPYGFFDAVNPSKNWTATTVLGIDQGPIVLMIENGRRDAVWRVMARDSVLARGLRRAGFTGTPPTVDAEALPTTGSLDVHVGPTPTRGAVTVRLSLAVPADVSVEVVDLLGRRVHVRDAGRLVGAASVDLDLADLPAGVYLVRVRAGADTAVRPLVLAR